MSMNFLIIKVNKSKTRIDRLRANTKKLVYK